MAGEEEREVCGEFEEPGLYELSTDPGLFDLTLVPFAVAVAGLGAGTSPGEEEDGIRFPYNRPVSETFLCPWEFPTIPAVLGSKDGIRFPMRPRCEADEGMVGPAVPNACVGSKGAAEGLLNLAILSLRDPETARGLASPLPPGDEERESEVGGVRCDLGLA